MAGKKTQHVVRPLRSPEVDPDRRSELDAVVSEWLTVPDVAERQGVSVSHVRKQLQDRELVAVRRQEGGPLSVPAAFLGPEGPLRELRGTMTVLADGGMTDAELIIWLFTPDPTLPVPGCPMDAIAAGFKTEVRRRAMETAF